MRTVCKNFKQLIEWQLQEPSEKLVPRMVQYMGLINYIEGGRRTCCRAKRFGELSSISFGNAQMVPLAKQASVQQSWEEKYRQK